MMLGHWLSDAKYAARRLGARPGYTLLAVLTLALGVGGTAAVYGIARGLLFEPLPYANEGEVGVFWKKADWSEQEFLHARGRFPGFRQVALYRPRELRLREGDAPTRLIPSVFASAELFEVLGARPLHGRGFQAGDDVEGAERVVVLSYGLWQELGGEASIIGTRLMLDGTPQTVIGVMPSGFWFPDPSVRIWMSEPLSTEAWTFDSSLVGRVAPGHDVRALATPIAQLTAMLDERFNYPAQWDKTKDPQITPIRDDLIGSMRPALYATLAAMALILIIACANVSALMLGQVHARSTELAVRLALGANRSRITQQLVVEAILIGFAAAALGSALAWVGYGVLARALPLGAWTETTTPNWTVFAAGTALALGAALLVVLVPVVSLWRGDLRPMMLTARGGTLEGRGGRLESGLVVAEVAVAVLIAAGAALIGRSVANLYAVEPNIRTEGVGVIDVTLERDRLPERQIQTIGQLTSAIAQLPGVRTAALVQRLPLLGGGYNVNLEIPRRSDLPNATTEFRMVTPGYLETMGFELRAGRTITAADRDGVERVVVINEALARKYFGNADPLGQQLGGEGLARVVGVVADAAERKLTDEAVPVRYAAVAQSSWVDEPQSLVLSGEPGADLAALLDAARATIERITPGVAVRSTTTMSHVLATAVGPARQVMSLLSLLTGLALTLGAIGIYGVIAHFAGRRRREWAIRIALGLPGSRAIARVVGHAALLVAAGIGLGILAASALARLLSALLYGVGALDPIAFAAAGTTLLVIGLLAALGPAWRAGTTDPAIVLREE